VALILDTANLQPGRRADAVAEVIRFSSDVPTRIVYNCSPDEVSARFEYFSFGETHLLKSQNTSQGLVTKKGSESDLLVISVKLAGMATNTQAPGRLLRDGDLFVTGLWRPFEFFDQGGENTAFYIPLARLGLEREYAMRAGESIHASPLAAQLRRHLEIVARDADALSQGPAAAMVGQATADLYRAALIAAVDEEPSRRDDWDQNLMTVIKGYITEHLADPDLGAERIAQAMFISVRQLYKLWEAEPGSLGQWVVERRLEAARQDLTSRRGRNQTIAAIARRWGFADSTHFSRRFRQAYGMSPREWRHAFSRSATLMAAPRSRDGSVHA
jgi:AraC-like DNA-binding protein